MAMENGYNNDEILSERAKELLKSEEYERLNTAVKNFSKTRSVETLCSNLFKIVSSSAKVDILAEVRRCLPKNQRNKFTRYCNELLKTEGLRKRRDFEKNGKIGEAKECKRGRDSENFAANFQGSPAKKTKQHSVKLLKSKAGKKVSQQNEKLAPDHAKDKKDAGTLKTQVRKFDTLSSKSANKIIILKRDSLNQTFGFRIRGGNSREPSINIAEVAKASLADRQGLSRGDQILRVNDKRCGKGGLNITELIRKIKAAKVLHMRVVTKEPACIDECKVEDAGEANGKERKKQEMHRLTTVSVYPKEDGWVGCCIRGGVDYACDVHVISIDAGSPAERAGVKAGDAIVKINGTRTKNLTHVQVVRLVITSGPCVKFSLKPGSKRRRSLRQQTADIRPTPLRTQHTRSHDVTPPQSPSFRQFHLPGYPHKTREVVVDSPSQLPLEVMSLDCLPPPPYTPEVPSRHRVLARGEEGQCTPQQPQESRGPQDLHCSQETGSTVFNQELQETAFRQEPQGINLGHEPHDTTFRNRRKGGPCQQEPQATQFELDKQGCQFQQIPQDAQFHQEQQETPSQVAIMEIISKGELSDLSDEVASFDENYMTEEFQDNGKTEQSYGPHSSVMQHEKIPSLDKGTPVKETPDTSLPSCTSQLPTRGNSTGSFLSQIPQFNKTHLKRVEDCSQSNTSEELHSSSSVNCHTAEKIQTITDTCSLSSSTNPSPPQGNGKESFLNQIRQFNKAKLKKLSDGPKHSARDQLEGNPSASSCNLEEVLQSTEGGKNEAQVNAQDSIDADGLLSALTRVMRSRARVLHDTLSSADEYDSDSSNDDSDDEWEL